MGLCPTSGFGSLRRKKYHFISAMKSWRNRGLSTRGTKISRWSGVPMIAIPIRKTNPTASTSPDAKWMKRTRPNWKWSELSPPIDGSGEPIRYPVTTRATRQPTVTQCQRRTPQP